MAENKISGNESIQLNRTSSAAGAEIECKPQEQEMIA
jgi:hypothetical protein